MLALKLQKTQFWLCQGYNAYKRVWRHAEEATLIHIWTHNFSKKGGMVTEFSA
jgi:hypothetical protein